jgi:hypothetical protein
VPDARPVPFPVVHPGFQAWCSRECPAARDDFPLDSQVDSPEYPAVQVDLRDVRSQEFQAGHCRDFPVPDEPLGGHLVGRPGALQVSLDGLCAHTLCPLRTYPRGVR